MDHSRIIFTLITIICLHVAKAQEVDLTDLSKESSFSKLALEVEPYFTVAFRKFHQANEEYELINPGNGCGYCEEQTSFTPVGLWNSNAGGLRLNLTWKKLYLTTSVGFETYRKDIVLDFLRINHHPKVPFGYITDTYRETDYFSFENNRVTLSFGMGFKLFKPDKRFNIIPHFRYNRSSSMRIDVSQNYYVQHRKYYWDQNPNPSNNYEWTKTSAPSRILLNKLVDDVSIGLKFELRPSDHFLVNFDLSYAFVSKSLFVMPTELLTESLRFRTTIGLAYRLPLTR